MDIRPMSLKEANIYVVNNHRHNDKCTGHKFSLGAYVDEKLVGVAICGRPLSRMLDNGKTLEVLRLCTDGTFNACSFLYGRCARVAKEMGYEKIITYILESEYGTSLKASGWLCEAENVGGANGWNCPSRPRVLSEETLFGEVIKRQPMEKKRRYAKILKRR